MVLHLPVMTKAHPSGEEEFSTGRSDEICFFLCQWRCSALIKMNCKLYGLFYYLNCHSKRYPPLRPILDAHTPMFKTNSRPTVQFDIIIVENMDDFMGSSDVVFRK